MNLANTAANNGGSGLSGFWDKTILQQIREDPGVGYLFEDDFTEWQLDVTQTTQVGYGSKYKIFSTGSGIISKALTVNSVAISGGVVGLGVDTDNDSTSIGVNQQSFRITGLPSTGKKLWFEARVAYSPITTNGLGWVLGLGETSLWTFATAVPLNGGVTFTNSGSFVGFSKPEDDTTTFDSVYSDRSAAVPTAIGDGDGTYATAFAFTKLGMMYDPNDKNVNGDNLGFYQDGVLLSSGLTNAEIAALTYLDSYLLSPMCSIVADSAGTAGLFYMDWWKCAQLR